MRISTSDAGVPLTSATTTGSSLRSTEDTTDPEEEVVCPGWSLVLPANVSSNCSDFTKEFQRCAVTCSQDAQRIGYFTCLGGTFVGQSVCVTLAEGSTVATVTKIAATLEVELQVLFEVPIADIQDMFKRAIAEALGVSVENVVKLLVLEAVRRLQDILAPVRRVVKLLTNMTGGRRLQENVKRYEVSYELVVPNSVDPDVLLEKASSVVKSDTPEFRKFQEVIATQEGMGQISSIVSKISPRMFKDEIITASDDAVTGAGDTNSSESQLLAESSTTPPLRVIGRSETDDDGVLPMLLVASVSLSIGLLTMVMCCIKRGKCRSEQHSQEAASGVDDKDDAV